MLHVPQTRVPKPRFPVIDVHTHLTFAKREQGVAAGEEVTALISAQDALAVMDRKGIRAMVNLTGGTGKGLEQTLGRVRPRRPRPLPQLHRAGLQPPARAAATRRRRPTRS